MTQSNEPTISEMNEAIALFDGWKLIKGDSTLACPSCDEGKIPSGWCICDQKRDRFQKDGKMVSRTYFQYHTSWDWLMPVVDKIHALKKHNPDGKGLCLMSQLTINMELDGYYNKGRCSILGHITHCYTLSIPYNYERVDLPSIFVHDKNTLIEAVHEAVYKFITWFNQQKQKDGTEKK